MYVIYCYTLFYVDMKNYIKGLAGFSRDVYYNVSLKYSCVVGKIIVMNKGYPDASL